VAKKATDLVCEEVVELPVGHGREVVLGKGNNIVRLIAQNFGDISREQGAEARGLLEREWVELRGGHLRNRAMKIDDANKNHTKIKRYPKSKA
jgi:hypothetical protein